MDYIIRVGGTLAAFVVGLYVLGLLTGRAILPDETKAALQPLITPLVIALVGFATLYLQKRQAAELSDGLGTKIGMTAAAQSSMIAEQVAAALKKTTDEQAAALALKVDADARAAKAEQLLTDARTQADAIISAAKADAQRLQLVAQVAALPSQVAAIPGITAQSVQPVPNGGSASIVDAIRDSGGKTVSEIQDNTAKVLDNSEKTERNTQAMLAAEEASQVPVVPKEPEGETP